LVSEGICPEDRVGIFMNRSADMIVSMLGILKAGGAYVPIDPEYPPERLKFIAEDTAVRWVLTQRQVDASLPAAAPFIYVDDAGSPISRSSVEPVMNRSTPESIAVVIYTSGSTGKPKAICIPHRAAVRTVSNTNFVQIEPVDRITQAGSPSFDAAIKEIWLALANGATLIGLSKEILLEPAKLARLLREERISIICLNTAYVHQIGRDAPEVLKGLRKIFFGGEAAEPGPLREILKHVGPNVLINSYGPAEGCVITTYHEITDIPEDAATVSIGRPVSNAQVYLLDRFMRPVPIGVEGEIYIGGAGVARGYLNRPELTSERFIPDTFSGKPGSLLYRTGDLARMRGNGELEFRGRADEQVKIRGHRIELAEVRQAIAAHPAVRQVFLMVREDCPGDKRLVAYVTLRHSLPAAHDRLRQHAKDKLPPYMVPSAFVVMDSIPLSTNGKIDWRALPTPTDRPDFGNSFEVAQTGLERKLMRIWQELLRVDRIGVNDNFFELGGHSLLAARLIARIEQETGENIPVAALFEAPTISRLAERMRERTYSSAWCPLVKLYSPEKSSIAKPFFCVHSLGANLVSFHQIASLMRGERPVYGLQPPGLDGLEQPLESIEMIASAYLKEIRRKQPHGPYYLGGVCIGGVVAYEIAQQLQAAGEEVQLVALIDSYLPGDLQHLHSRPKLTEYLDWHVGDMLLLPPVARWRYVAKWLANGGIRFGRALGWGERSSLAQATNKIGEAYRRAMAAYKPKPYSGKIVQLMCADASHRSYEDRRLAWSSLASGGFEVRIVPGNHLTMVEEPHAKTLAQELQACLDRTSGNTHSSHRDFEEKEVLQGTLKSRRNVSDRKLRRVTRLSTTASS
jgi:amino acid adenylation domain-containing protein